MTLEDPQKIQEVTTLLDQIHRDAKNRQQIAYELAETIRRVCTNKNAWALTLEQETNTQKAFGKNKTRTLVYSGGSLVDSRKSEQTRPQFEKRNRITAFLENVIHHPETRPIFQRLPEELQQRIKEEENLIHTLAFSHPEILLRHLPETLHEAMSETREPGDTQPRNHDTTLRLIAQTQPELTLGARAEALHKKKIRKPLLREGDTQPEWESILASGAENRTGSETEILFLYGTDLLKPMALEKLFQRHMAFTCISPGADSSNPLHTKLPAHCPNNPIYIPGPIHWLNNYQKSQLLKKNIIYVLSGIRVVRPHISEEQYLEIFQRDTGMFLQKYNEPGEYEDPLEHAEAHGRNNTRVVEAIVEHIQHPQRYGFPFPLKKETILRILGNKQIPSEVREAAATRIANGI